MSQITDHELPNLAALLSLLSEHPTVTSSPTLEAAVSAIHARLVAVWDRLEAEHPPCQGIPGQG